MNCCVLIHLDEEMENEIVQIFKTLAHEHNKCVIVVTHSQEIAREADEKFVIRKGTIQKDEDLSDE